MRYASRRFNWLRIPHERTVHLPAMLISESLLSLFYKLGASTNCPNCLTPPSLSLFDLVFRCCSYDSRVSLLPKFENIHAVTILKSEPYGRLELLAGATLYLQRWNKSQLRRVLPGSVWILSWKRCRFFTWLSKITWNDCLSSKCEHFQSWIVVWNLFPISL